MDAGLWMILDAAKYRVSNERTNIDVEIMLTIMG